MSDPGLRDSYDEIILDGMPLRLRGVMPDSNLATFQRKMVVGDYNQDSNPLLSSWVISDLSGGHGVYDMNESSDSTRYYIGNMYTRYPAQVTSGLFVEYINFGGEAYYFLGDLNVGGVWRAYFCADQLGEIGIAKYVIPTTFISFATISTLPVGPSTVYRGTADHDYILIPLGEVGYALVDGEAESTTEYPPDEVSPALLHSRVWDNKLIGIDVDGQLWWSISPFGPWTSYGETARLPTAEVPHRLIPYFDRSGQPCLFVLTETAMRQFDPSGPQLFDVDVSFPPGPYQGEAGDKWSGDLYFSVGMGVHRYTGGALSAIGLDRDSGLPAEYNGHIVDLIPSYNSLYAMVTKPNLDEFDFIGTPPTPMSSIHEWTGSGWHMVWQTTDNIIPFSAGVSRGTGKQSVMWATKDDDGSAYAHLMELPSTFANPRQRLTKITGFTQITGFLETSVFDAGMQGYKKVASSFDIKMTVLNVGFSGYFRVQYKIDDAADWTVLGDVTTTGDTSFPFGSLEDGIHPGLIFERIQFRFRANNATFLMESAVLSFIKTVPPSNSWTPTVDMTYAHAGNSPEVMRQHIENILKNRLFVPLVFRGNTYRVIVSSSSGSSQTGFDEGNLRQVSLLEVPETLGDVN